MKITSVTSLSFVFMAEAAPLPPPKKLDGPQGKAPVFRPPLQHRVLTSVPELASGWEAFKEERRCFHCKKFLIGKDKFCGHCHGIMPDKTEPVTVKFVHIKPPAAPPLLPPRSPSPPTARATLAEVRHLPKPKGRFTDDPNYERKREAKRSDMRARFLLFRVDCNRFYQFDGRLHYIRAFWDDPWTVTEQWPAEIAQMHPDDA